MTLTASSRKILGKESRFLRRQGITPTHVFGHNVDSLALQCPTARLQEVIARAGRTRLISLKIEGERQPRAVFIREIQRDAITGQLIHVDLYQVKKTERIKVDVPIVFSGEAPALKQKESILVYGISSLEIESLPDQIPPQIQVDLGQLTEMDQAIHIKDLPLGPGVTLLADPEQLVVKVGEARVRKIEEEVVKEAVPAEAAAEGQPAEAGAAKGAEAEKPA